MSQFLQPGRAKNATEIRWPCCTRPQSEGENPTDVPIATRRYTILRIYILSFPLSLSEHPPSLIPLNQKWRKIIRDVDCQQLIGIHAKWLPFASWSTKKERGVLAPFWVCHAKTLLPFFCLFFSSRCLSPPKKYYSLKLYTGEIQDPTHAVKKGEKKRKKVIWTNGKRQETREKNVCSLEVFSASYLRFKMAVSHHQASHGYCARR